MEALSEVPASHHRDSPLQLLHPGATKANFFFDKYSRDLCLRTTLVGWSNSPLLLHPGACTRANIFLAVLITLLHPTSLLEIIVNIFSGTLPPYHLAPPVTSSSTYDNTTLTDIPKNMPDMPRKKRSGSCLKRERFIVQDLLLLHLQVHHPTWFMSTGGEVDQCNLHNEKLNGF